MKLKRRDVLRLGAVWLAAAFLLAFFLRDIILHWVIQPMLYWLWMLNLLYRAIPQAVLWVTLVSILLMVAISLLAQNISLRNLLPRTPERTSGPVQRLSSTLQRKSQGIYFKWQVARSLAEIALHLQELRTHNQARDLQWDASDALPEVRRFLEAGLKTSFSDYPMPGVFQPRRETPFDMNLDPVIDYLESQTMETEYS